MTGASTPPGRCILDRRRFLRHGIGGATFAALPASASERRVILNDASRLDPTPVAKHVTTRDRKDDLIAALRKELKDAAAAGRPVSVSAARHSMGGQSLPRDGTAVTLDSRRIEVDVAAKTFRPDPGARWSDVIAHLDPLGFSPIVMQSNSDFGVASTFCVNSHGWPSPHGPFGSTVRSVRLLMADGSLVSCSRTENADLFALAMGGYGLFGIVVDLEVDMTENLNLVAQHAIMPAVEFSTRFLAAITDKSDVRMAYGRLSLTRRRLFEEALMVTYRPASDKTLIPVSAGGHFAALTDDIYRSQIGYEVMKWAR